MKQFSPQKGIRYVGRDRKGKIVLLTPSQRYPDHWYIECVESGISTGWKRPMMRAGLRIAMKTLGVNPNFKETPGGCLDDTVRQNTISRSRHEMEIYFIETIGVPCVKIGVTRGNSEHRLTLIATGCPLDIRVLGTMPGGFRLEKDIHRQFNHLRIRGEWFHLTRELRKFIQSNTQ